MTALPKHIITSDFESLYFSLRKNEGRLYTDEEVGLLPDIHKNHQHYKEWLLRKQSSQKLIEYLRQKGEPLDILEIGCGNGWLSRRLSAIRKSKVIGSDINFEEVQQAARVFRDISNLHFIYGKAENDVFKDDQFDIVLFAASIQYFPFLPEIISRSLRLLKKNGEIHIIDSHFYSVTELDGARKRSGDYFKSIGFPEMIDQYFHHTLDSLKNYNYSILHNRKRFLTPFLKDKNPFYWIRIKK